MVVAEPFTTLVQFGGIGVGVAAIWALYRISNGVLKNVAASLRDVSETMNAMRESTHQDHLLIITEIQKARPKRRTS